MALAFALSVLLIPVAVKAETSSITTNATCQSSFNWAFNSIDQSPCLVAAYLHSPCNGGQAVTQKLPPNSSYTAGTQFSPADACVCNTVTYSMLMACALCQGNPELPWMVYIANCTANEVIFQGYPVTIPSETRIPGWAYLNVQVSGSFDAVQAENAASSLPESAVPSSVTQTSTTVSSTSTTLSAATTAASFTHSKVPGGAIAGGTVGGIMVLVIAYLALRYMARRARRQSGSPTYIVRERDDKGDLVLSSTSVPTLSANSRVAVMPKFYDPDDPSTFPNAPSVVEYTTKGHSASSSISSSSSIASLPVGHIKQPSGNLPVIIEQGTRGQ